MGIFDHLKHLIEDEIRGGHHGRHHGGHHGGHHGHHYDDHYYDPNCDPNYVQQRQPQPRRPSPSQQSSAPMPCPKCGRYNPSHVLFCQQCGKSLAGDGENITCTGCSAQLAPDAKFCSSCGQPQV